MVCYGFLILALALYWPNEANTYLLFFCLSNGILAVIAAFKPKEDCDLCRWNGILSKLHKLSATPFLFSIPRKSHSFFPFPNNSVMVLKFWI